MLGIVLNGITDARLAGKYAISSTLLKSKSSRGGSLRGLRSSEDSATVSSITSPVGEMERVRITLQTVTTACWCLVLVARISDHQGVYGLFFSSLLILGWKKGYWIYDTSEKAGDIRRAFWGKKCFKESIWRVETCIESWQWLKQNQ